MCRAWGRTGLGAVAVLLLLCIAGCGGGEGQGSKQAATAVAADPGCEATQGQPKHVEPAVFWRTLVRACQSADGSQMYVRNESSSVIVVQSMTAGTLAVEPVEGHVVSLAAGTLRTYAEVPGAVRLAGGEAVLVSAQDGPVRVDFEIDAKATVAVAAATGLVRLAQARMGLRAPVAFEAEQCAHDVADLFERVSALDEYFRRAAASSGSCQSLYRRLDDAQPAEEETLAAQSAKFAHDAAHGAWIDALGVGIAEIVAHR
jgi:hypothetical protein